MKMIKKYLFLFFISTVIFSCTDFDIENENSPTKESALSEPDAVKSVASGLFNTWFTQEQHNFGSVGPAMWVMADWGTVTWSNYATRDMSEEPRIFFNNQPSYGYQNVTKNYWRYMYNVLTSANDVALAIENGLEIGYRGADTEMVKGIANFMQGLGNGYIGLVFDRGYPSDEFTDYTTLESADYKTSIIVAINQLEKSIVVFDNNSFTLPSDWINGNSFTNHDMSKLAHSFIARLLVYSARNKEQTDAIDWGKVLDHAEKGITTDFNVLGDGRVSGSNWTTWYKYYLARPNWGKVDMRIVHMLDETIPANWPKEGIAGLPHEGRIISNDQRVVSDFEYNSSNNRPERGLYRWSTYRYKRLDNFINNQLVGDVIMMRKAEIDLFKAEALLRLGKVSEAAAVVNAGTRVTRGGLDLVEVDADAVFKAIAYERAIELPLTGMGIEYFDMRRTGQLQDGSLLHFPMPAQQLEVVQEAFYTFGGLIPQYGTPNEDVSVNGWYKPE